MIRDRAIAIESSYEHHHQTFQWATELKVIFLSFIVYLGFKMLLNPLNLIMNMNEETEPQVPECPS